MQFGCHDPSDPLQVNNDAIFHFAFAYLSYLKLQFPFSKIYRYRWKADRQGGWMINTFCKRWILIPLLLAIQVACNYQEQIGPPNSSSRLRRGVDSSTGCAPATDYAAVMENVLGPRCVRCHGRVKQEKGLNVENYSNLFSRLGSVRHQIVTGLMPKGGLPSEEREYVAQWIDAGAPEKIPANAPANCTQTQPTPVAGPAGPPEPTLIEFQQSNFEWLYNRILEPRCSFCHGPRGREFSLTTYEDYMRIVNTHDPENSVLIKVLRGTNEFYPIMPPRDSGFKIFNDEEINAVVAWIRNGAPEKAPSTEIRAR